MRTASSIQKPYWTTVCLRKSNGIFLSCRHLGSWSPPGRCRPWLSPFSTFSQEEGTLNCWTCLQDAHWLNYYITRSPSKANEQLNQWTLCPEDLWPSIYSSLLVSEAHSATLISSVDFLPWVQMMPDLGFGLGKGEMSFGLTPFIVLQLSEREILFV